MHGHQPKLKTYLACCLIRILVLVQNGVQLRELVIMDALKQLSRASWHSNDKNIFDA